jgi:hypothetical protein
MTNIGKNIALTGALIFAAAGYAAPASAQATRTWVSGVGNDADPCSRTAPCKTFAGAIIKTAPGGEINCLDPGGYGGVTINKALSIVCDYTEGGALVAGAGVNGITVNAAATDAVYLSGIDFHGSLTATNGIRFLVGATLHVQNCTIRRFNGSNGLGINFSPSVNAQLTVLNTTITENGTGATGGGILIRPTGTGSARATLQDVRVQNNANEALRVDTTGSTGSGATVMIVNSQFLSSSNGVSAVSPAATPTVQVMLTDSLVALNGGSGINASGAGTVVRVGNSTITANNVGVTIAASAIVNTYKDNRLDGNATNGVFTAPEIPLK